MQILPLEPSWERKALNRCTFGCREVDELYVQRVGWDAWVKEQLSPPNGDDSEMLGHLKRQALDISYPSSEDDPSSLNHGGRGWEAVDEDRQFNYLFMSERKLYEKAIYVGDTHP